MTRTVPGSGAIIRPEFNSVFGVRAIFVESGGDGYDANDPPKLTIQNACLLYTSPSPRDP